METKLRLKTNSMELEFEGTQSFLKDELLDILGSLLSRSPSGTPATTPLANGDEGARRIEISTGSIAARLWRSRAPTSFSPHVPTLPSWAARIFSRGRRSRRT